MQDGLLLQRHVVEDEVLESLEFLRIRQTAGKEKEAYLLIAETLLLHDGMHQVLDLVTTEIQPSLDGNDGPVRKTVITHDVADVGESDKHAGTVLVAESALDIEFLEKLGIHAGAALHLVRKLVYQVFVKVFPCHRLLSLFVVTPPHLRRRH